MSGFDEKKGRKMKFAVVGSINMGMTVAAERIPMKWDMLRAAFLLCIEKISALDIFQFFCCQAERGDQLLIFCQRGLRDNNFHSNILIEIADG